RELSQISIANLLASMRKAGEDGFLNPHSLPLSDAVEKVVMRIERAIPASVEGLSVRAMIDETNRTGGWQPAIDRPRVT
ncbi:MAG: hypothetical protein M3496_13890, partial [Pseudomonadota bacterium]|nr:hypothetical protein [Pseudomonadota bacterium]